MTIVEFVSKHEGAAEVLRQGRKVAVRYRNVVKTDPLTIDNRCFGLLPNGSEVELLPQYVEEWVRSP